MAAVLCEPKLLWPGWGSKAGSWKQGHPGWEPARLMLLGSVAALIGSQSRAREPSCGAEQGGLCFSHVKRNPRAGSRRGGLFQSRPKEPSCGARRGGTVQVPPKVTLVRGQKRGSVFGLAQRNPRAGPKRRGVVLNFEKTLPPAAAKKPLQSARFLSEIGGFLPFLS